MYMCMYVCISKASAVSAYCKLKAPKQLTAALYYMYEGR